jgi:hypothetical protein
MSFPGSPRQNANMPLWSVAVQKLFAENSQSILALSAVARCRTYDRRER